MIARIWRGAVGRDDRDRYAEYMRGTGVEEYAETSGNRGVLMLRRDDGDRTEFVMVTLWESLDAVRGFAGDDVERAVFYPDDDAFLVERDLTATHYEVLEARGVTGGA
jgi:heme-degrading monooxygenase HmoA